MFFFFSNHKIQSEGPERLISGWELSKKDQGTSKPMILVLGKAAGLMECYKTLGLDVLTHVLQGQTEMGRAACYKF